ncbi:MAG: hypothetical protein JNJ44_02115 [Zoogloeaceae bacterium]|nr:hypothetical protein [Zoogloeaceae bacterium]
MGHLPRQGASELSSAKAEFNPDSLENIAYGISGRCDRAGVLLRRAQEMFGDNVAFDEHRQHDMWTLVEMAIESLPSPDRDVFDPLEKYLWSIRPMLKRAATERQALEKMVGLMAEAARTETPQEMDSMVLDVFWCVTEIENGGSLMNVFCDVARSRGYVVLEVAHGAGRPVFPRIFGSAKELKKYERHQKQFSAIADEKKQMVAIFDAAINGPQARFKVRAQSDPT